MLCCALSVTGSQNCRVVQSNLVLRSVEEAVVYSSFVIGQLFMNNQ